MKSPIVSTNFLFKVRKFLSDNPLIALIFGIFLGKILLFFLVLPYAGDSIRFRYGLHNPFGDGYNILADNINSGIGYRWFPDTAETMMREPGYPLFLSIVFRFGHRIEAVRFSNLLLSMGAATLLASIAKHFTSSRHVAFFAILIYSLSPAIIIAELRGGLEILLGFLLLFFFLALLNAFETKLAKDFLVSGFIFGMASLVRSAVLFYPIVLLAFLVLTAQSYPERARAIRNIVILWLGVSLMITPWVIRNYSLVNQFVPMASVKGLSLHDGLYACTGMLKNKEFGSMQLEAGRARQSIARSMGVPFRSDGYWFYFYKPQDEISFYKNLQNSTLLVYNKNKFMFAQCFTKNILNFWVLGKSWSVTLANVLIQTPLVVVSFVGLWILKNRGLLSKAMPILLFVAYYVSVSSLVIAQARYSVPLLPLMGLFGSFAIASFLHQIRRWATTS